jgi:hypothetical protein
VTHLKETTMGLTRTTKSFSAVLSTQKQSLKSINELIARVGGLAGCEACGRIAYIDLHFHDDPIADLRDFGVISHGQQGF